jgi:hypothetical protein
MMMLMPEIWILYEINTLTLYGCQENYYQAELGRLSHHMRICTFDVYLCNLELLKCMGVIDVLILVGMNTF